MQRQAQHAQVASSVQWMQQHLHHGVDAALYTPWILDCDTTIKVLYGRQQAGAAVSYNPHKPGRPSHAIQTYWVDKLRMVLDAALEAGDRHAAKHSRAGLVALLEDLPKEQWPRLDVLGGGEFGGRAVALCCFGESLTAPTGRFRSRPRLILPSTALCRHGTLRRPG